MSLFRAVYNTFIYIILCRYTEGNIYIWNTVFNSAYGYNLQRGKRNIATNYKEKITETR